MEAKESKDVNNLIFGITYWVYYKDDTNRDRKKEMKLLASDETFFWFFNIQTRKQEAIPKRFINRMEAILDEWN